MHVYNRKSQFTRDVLSRTSNVVRLLKKERTTNETTNEGTRALRNIFIHSFQLFPFLFFLFCFLLSSFSSRRDYPDEEHERARTRARTHTQHSTGTVQYSTVQYSTAQHSTDTHTEFVIDGTRSSIERMEENFEK